MINLEERVAACWSPEVRPLIAETHRCYATGSARAAIVLTWTAVCADVIEKLRRLAEDGEGEAKPVVEKVEKAQGKVDRAAIKTMQEVEISLLDTALTVQLIDAVQHRKLDQLRLDRNLCAHPSLSPLGDIFAPSLDDARAHLAVALDALLVHVPSQGRRVVDRIRALLADTAFIGEDFIAQTSFDRVKPAVRRRLVNLVVKHALLEVGVEDFNAKELADRAAVCVTAFARRDRGLVRSELSHFVQDLSAKPTDVQLRAVGRLGHLDLFWETTDNVLRDQVNGVIAGIDPSASSLTSEHLSLLSLVAVDDVRALLPALDATFRQLALLPKAAVIGRHPGRYFVPQLAPMLQEAWSYRTAEAVCQDAVLTCASFLTTEDLTALLHAWIDNDQCRVASKMPEHALALYRATARLPGAAEAWRNFTTQAKELSPDWEYYQYTEVAALLPPPTAGQ
ncbi:hypothetical protein [Streptomyces sp. PT12]|uniref:hypothetical protein n=1 Tax=Streptomyces sp. PT12 TaxID=1510197 RepID=UPI000DE520C4|nr:hypothetical protein [Streptomyces sp. PT12]RBM22968.1 hypothetical protein DEH69_03685 [Streptomyces sp. PT12]